MEILKFNLSGKTAFFKKPEVNTYEYFTYGQIHKAALLGMLGAILGYRGYGSVREEKNGKISFGRNGELPEYYQKLRGLKVGIEPCSKNGYLSKKVQVFNNSVGYASAEQGGNLIVKEQWLENPEWNIYVLLNGEEAEKITSSLQNNKAVYLPYLGKNEHFADISKVKILDGKKMDGMHLEGREMQSLFLKKYAVLDFDMEEMEERIFKYEESLPIGIEEDSLMYRMEKFIYTNLPLVSYEGEIYEISEAEGKKIVAFF